MWAPRLILLALLVLASFLPALAQDDAGAIEAIRQVERRWAEAWNRHDAGALALLMAEEGHFITVGGRWLKGRRAFLDHHAPLMAGQFVESAWETTGVEVDLLRPDVAIAHVSWSMRGDRDPDGTPRPPRTGIFTRVYTREGGGAWRIRASQNTNHGIPPAPR